jgi:sec-independent protein translocase protein TatB
MFDIGFWELALLAVIGLIVLGPERLPAVARAVGLWTGRVRGYVRGITDELDREIRLRDARGDLERARRELTAETGLEEIVGDQRRGDASRGRDAAGDERR